MEFILFRQARDLSKQLRPIAVAMDQTQRDRQLQATLDAYHICFELLREFWSTTTPKTVEKHLKQAVQTCHLVAYKLHPKYQGALLSDDQHEGANQSVLKKNPEFFSVSISFHAKANPFPESFFTTTTTDSINPVTW